MTNIIITGASSGIGKSLALNYAGENINLLLIARNKKKLDEVAISCKNSGANVISKICDVTDEEKLAKILLDFDKKYPADLIIANAGISAGTSNGGEDLAQLKNIFDINIYGVTNSIYPLIPKLKERQKGQIAIISSIASFRGLPSSPAYSSSKACIRYLGEALRGDLLNDNIKVNIICPGYITTPMTDANNFPMPFIMPVDKAAKYIKRKLQKNQRVIIFPKLLYLSVKLTKLLPNFIADKLFSSLPKK